MSFFGRLLSNFICISVMVYTRAGYVIPRRDLDVVGRKHMGKVPGEWASIDPYIEAIKEIFNAKASIGLAEFDKLFSEVEVISLKAELPGAKPEGAILLVRADGDPEESPDYKYYFAESGIDKKIKAALEQCLGLNIGPWRAFGLTYH